jgi:hypothetical protein
MMFTSKTCHFALLLAATCNAVVSAGDVPLGTAEKYVILAKSGISTVAPSIITGDIAVSPIAASAITEFELHMDVSLDFSTDATSQLCDDCKAYASDYDDGVGDTPAELTAAVGDMETAYTAAAGLPNEDASRTNIGAGTLGGTDTGGNGTPLSPGVYTFGTDVNIANDIYFDADGYSIDDQGVSTAEFIIQIEGNLEQAASTEVHLTGGALAKNIFWQVSGLANFGADAEMKGILLVATKVDFVTGSKLEGRVLTQTACNLQKATIAPPS